MERMDSLLNAISDAKRAELIAQDTETDPSRMLSRAEVSPGCLLKHNDDVEVNGMIARVVCPAETEGWFYSLIIDSLLIVLGQHEAQYVTDRAPADPEETPMPIFAA